MPATIDDSIEAVQSLRRWTARRDLPNQTLNGDIIRMTYGKRRFCKPICRGISVACCGLALSLFAAGLQAQESRSLAFSAGAFNFNKSGTVLEGGVEYRAPINVWKLAAAGGVTVNLDGAFYGFGGLRRDFRLGGPWIITPAFGIALYEKGGGKDLGGLIEFRSAIEIGREWANRHRLALVLYHLSNAGLYDLNPGINSLIVTYSLPLK